ncbi:MAG: CHAT domain-containing tetratricopeptide repeat protein [Saprospiraceae bacterium]|nr:CHAT domain-containing tetratricopeptide repeat protein [Saprospiraceae bacterium]
MKPRCYLFLLLPLFFSTAIQAQTSPDSLLARRLYDEAMMACDSTRWAEAALLLDSAITLLQPTDAENLALLSESLYQRGFVARQQEKFAKAIEVYRLCLPLREKQFGAGHWKIGYLQYNWGVSLQFLAQYTEALGHYQQAVNILQPWGGDCDTLLADIYHNMAVCHFNLGTFKQTVEYSEKAIAYYEKTGQEVGFDASWTYNNLSWGYYTLGDFPKAKISAEKSKNVRMHLYGPDHPETAMAYNNLSMIELAMGDRDVALAYAHKAIAIRELQTPPSVEDLGDSYTNLCGIYYELGEYALAESCGLKAISIYNKNLMQFLSKLPMPHINLGNTYVLMERFDEAVAQYDKAQAYYNFGGKNAIPGLINLHNNKSVAYERQGNYPAFLGQIRQAIALVGLTEENTSQKVMLYTNLGVAYTNLGHLDSAETALLQALSYSANVSAGGAVSEITALLGMARCRHRQGRFAEALSFLDRAKSVNRYQKRQFETVRNLYPLLATLVEEAAVFADRPDGEKEQNLLKALDIYAEACDGADFLWQSAGLDQMTRSTYLTAVYPAYEGYIQTAYALEGLSGNGHFAGLAWRMSERARGHALREAFQRTRAREVAGIPSTVIYQEAAFVKSIGFWERQRVVALAGGQDSLLQAAEDSLISIRRLETRFWAGIKNDYPDYWALSRDPYVAPLSDVQNRLDSGACQLGYYAGDTSLYAFVLNKDSLRVLKLPLDFPLEQWIDTLRFGLTGSFYDGTHSDVLLKQTADAYAEAAVNLYNKLVLPVSKWLTDRVTIIPDGPLAYIPFDALLTKRPTESTRFNSHAYWGLEKQISYAYSATLQHAMQHRTAPGHTAWSVLAMAPFFRGNPDTLREREQPGALTVKGAVNRQGLEPLPHSGKEVKDIIGLFGGKDVYGTSATRDVFLEEAPNCRIVHLSTHGNADDNVGDNTWIAFSAENDPAVFDKLYLREVYGLRIHADLVTLSACETGLGRLQRGEGVVSLARAFAFAGAGSICMSLWQVSDAHSAELMRLFYANLRAGMTKDAALQEARRVYVQGRKGVEAHPYYWSGFLLVGDVEKL